MAMPYATTRLEGVCRRRWRACGRLWMLLVAAASIGACSDPSTRFTGIWKSDCDNYWGVQIKPAGGGGRVLYFSDAEGNLLHLVERSADSPLR